MKKLIFFFLLAFLPLSCSHAANYNGTLGTELSITMARVKIDSPNGEGSLELKGTSKVRQKFYNPYGYAHTVIFVSDIIVGNKTLQILPVPGTNMNGRAIIKAERLTWLGNSGVLFWFAPTGTWYTTSTSAQVGQIYPIDLLLKVRATTAIPAGTNISTLRLGNEEYFSDSLNSDALNGLISFGGASGINATSVEVTSVGYCTSGNNSSQVVALNHGVVSADNVDGNSKAADIAYECNTEYLPKVYFLPSYSKNLDLQLCDGLKTSLSLDTITRGEFSFNTSFKSVLHRTANNICSGPFLGNAVAVINYN
ncbi:hypothetical protein G8G22_004814 [Escherichia coli]|nr:hypothetical protein [Escherichia coli]EFJ2737191.1 hypothetical protein [Escherichia coli]EFJ2983191.1 hypothetical protein [Escherichia coli]EFK7859087.1 hypothetical protein [Escherichia coli]EGH1375129.1 hypothetical protein [Escherichia coli]